MKPHKRKELGLTSSTETSFARDTGRRIGHFVLSPAIGAVWSALPSIARPILQADAYAGYNALYLPDRNPGPVTEALCRSHARREFFVLIDIAANARRGRPRRRSRRTPSRPSNASTCCSMSSATSMVLSQPNALPYVRSGVPLGAECRSSPSWKNGCAANGPNSRETRPPPNRSITCSSTGWASRASSMMGASASGTTRPNERYAAGSRQEVLALRRLPTRRRSRCHHVHADRNRPPQRCRPAGLAP